MVDEVTAVVDLQVTVVRRELLQSRAVILALFFFIVSIIAYAALNDGSDELDGFFGLIVLLKNEFAADFTPEKIEGALLVALQKIEEAIDHLESDFVLTDFVQDKAVLS